MEDRFIIISAFDINLIYDTINKRINCSHLIGQIKSTNTKKPQQYVLDYFMDQLGSDCISNITDCDIYNGIYVHPRMISHILNASDPIFADKIFIMMCSRDLFRKSDL